MPSPKDLALRAIDLVYGDRNLQHGDPGDVYYRVAKLWSAFLDIRVTPEQAALMMLLLKLSRETVNPNEDNIVDAHGFLLVYGRVRDASF